uniref:methylated diphthine methylhydrolase n=1 Tax=Henneguya salminicola TaxID=69463 RepID=A0A6G3MI47_HENSL
MRLILLDVLKYNSGVLSLQFIENSLKFVAALSSGSVGLFHIAKNKKIKLLEEVCIKTNEELCLNIYEVNNIVWFTTSNGNVGTCVLTNSGISKQNVFQSDDKYESWSVISHEFEPNIGYSCSDDGLIHIWDVRIQKKSGSFNKYHDYGVCSLSWPNPQINNLLCSGGFDNNIYFWDPRVLKCPSSGIIVTHSVWNVKWVPLRKRIASIAALSDGNCCIELAPDHLSLTQLSSYSEPKSIVYCTDIQFSTKEDTTDNLICCTSFYDCMLHVWKQN